MPEPDFLLPKSLQPGISSGHKPTTLLVVSCVVLGIGGLAVWRAWNSHRAARSQQREEKPSERY